jgi:heme exporter protein C
MATIAPSKSNSRIQGLIWKMTLGALMAFVCYGAFFIAKGGVNFTQDGNTARIVFFHVPVAIMSYVAYVVGWLYALKQLRTPNTATDRKSSAAMELGFVYCAIATVTGSVFAGAQWGSYWNWDPREVSIVIMLLLYAAYFVLRGAVEDPLQRGRLSAVYVLIAFVPATFLIWVVPRIPALQSLHPPDTVVKAKNTSMDYKIVLYSAFIAFAMLFTWLFQLRCRILEQQEARRIRRMHKIHG